MAPSSSLPATSAMVTVAVSSLLMVPVAGDPLVPIPFVGVPSVTENVSSSSTYGVIVQCNCNIRLGLPSSTRKVQCTPGTVIVCSTAGCGAIRKAIVDISSRNDRIVQCNREHQIATCHILVSCGICYGQRGIVVIIYRTCGRRTSYSNSVGRSFPRPL